MLGIYFMQQWYGLSDPVTEDSLYNITSIRRFVGLSLDDIPDELMILRCRHRLERNNLTQISNRHVSEVLMAHMTGDTRLVEPDTAATVAARQVRRLPEDR